jgi:hypothetical protein
MMTTIEKPGWAGKPGSKRSSAARPPADAPMPTSGNFTLAVLPNSTFRAFGVFIGIELLISF